MKRDAATSPGDIAALPQPAGWRLHFVASPDPVWRGVIAALDALEPDPLGPAAAGVQVGRAPETPPLIRIDDSTLSRRHVELAVASPLLLRVTDLTSSNGTFVNGQRIQEALAGDGAVIRLGANVIVVERDLPDRLITPDLPLRDQRTALLTLADEIQPLKDAGGQAISWRTVLHEETVESLLLHTWPENQRELRAVLAQLRRHVGAEPVPRSALPLPLQKAHFSAIRAEDTARLGVRLKPTSEPREAPQDVDLRQVLAEERGELDNVARRLGRHRQVVSQWLEHAGIDHRELEAYRAGQRPPSER